MFRTFYGETCIGDPRDEQLVTLISECVMSLEEPGTYNFTLPYTNPWAGNLDVMSKEREIVLVDDGVEVFRGRVVIAEESFDKSWSYSCEGQRAYLNDVVLPPYKAGEDGVPDSPDGLFDWYVGVYNSKVPEHERIKVGVNEGWKLKDESWLYRASDLRPTVWEEIREKLITQLGGIIRIRSEGDVRYIDWLADGTGLSTQTIEFGVNLTDYTRRTDALEFCTAVVPFSHLEYDEYPEEGEERPEWLDISGLPDRQLEDGYVKRGDAVVDVAAEAMYGVIERSLQCDGVTDPETLVQNALKEAKNARLGDELEISAFDLHRVDPEVRAIAMGDFVRVISRPHGFDAYMLCTSLTLKPNDACFTYTLGTAGTTLTKQQQERLDALNATVGAQVQAVQGATEEAKKAADEAASAQSKAESAEGSLSDLSQRLDQTVESVTESLNSKSEEIETIKGAVEGVSGELSDTNRRLEDIEAFIVRGMDSNGNPFIRMFTTANELEMWLTNERLSFYDAGVEAAYISGQKLYVNVVEVTGQMQMGEYAWVTNGDTLDLKYVG